MLRSVRSFEDYGVHASDGEIGSVSDFYFDDEHWAIRYLVVDTGTFFSGRRVLVSPVAFRQADWSSRQFHLALTREKVKNGPNIDLDRPVSRQHEREYFRYYAWPSYWDFAGPGQPGVWGNCGLPSGLAAGGAPPPPQPEQDGGDPHLRSVREVVGYRIQGSDGEIGHVDDFIVDDETWAIRYLVIDTRNWWLDRKVLVAPHWAERISWDAKNVYLNLPRDTIKHSPEWLADAPVNRQYETRLYDYYGRPAYWHHGERP
jgi:sporulation protein YlmC with PRC-barrel domain